jgi:hypothetical protein
MRGIGFDEFDEFDGFDGFDGSADVLGGRILKGKAADSGFLAWVCGFRVMDQQFRVMDQRFNGCCLASIAVVVVVVAVVAVVVSVIFMVPVPFVHLPTLPVVVVVRVAPVGSGVGWAVPASSDPDVASVVDTPVAVNPLIAFARGTWTYLVAQGRRGSANIDVNLREGGHSKGYDHGSCW